MPITASSLWVRLLTCASIYGVTELMAQPVYKTRPLGSVATEVPPQPLPFCGRYLYLKYTASLALEFVCVCTVDCEVFQSPPPPPPPSKSECISGEGGGSSC